jgi:hypothetical protein
LSCSDDSLSGAGAGGAGPFYSSGDLVTAADPVQLEERGRVGRDHVLQGLAGERGQSGQSAGLGGGSGHRDLTVWVHPLNTGRGDQHGKADLLSVVS